MNIRREDQPLETGGHPVKITREIPLWGILSVVGALGAQGVSTYYGQQKLSENVEKLGTEVQHLTAKINDMRADQRGLQVQLDGLERRVTILEARTK